MNPRPVLQWSLRLLPLALLLPVFGCAEHHGPITVQVDNKYAAPIEVYQTGLGTAGTRETKLIGKVDAHGSATFPKALQPGEKVYHLKFKGGEKFLSDVVMTGSSLEKKLGSGDTWSVTAGP